MGIWDIFQDWDLVPLRDLEAEASRLKTATERDADRLYDLNRRVTHLAMISAALWELLKKKADLSEDDLRRTLEVGVALAMLGVEARARSPRCLLPSGRRG